ncbi:hypothetical protein IV102_04200 [bacterium]|nr:hypothetical protein [bacterium]
MKRLLLVLALANGALADDRIQIEQAYRRSHRAMALKYIDGVFSIQSTHYKLIDPEGVQLDQAVQRGRLEHMLSTALKVEEESKILTFRHSGKRAHCQVRYCTRLRRIDASSQKPMVIQIDTVCEDDWSKAGKDWLLDLTKVTHQESHKVKP